MNTEKKFIVNDWRFQTIVSQFKDCLRSQIPMWKKRQDTIGHFSRFWSNPNNNVAQEKNDATAFYTLPTNTDTWVQLWWTTVHARWKNSRNDDHKWMFQ